MMMIIQKLIHIFFIILVSVSLGKVLSKNAYLFEYVTNNEETLSQHTQQGFNDIVHGSYSILQPDGKLRVVHYKADNKNGFKAHIKYYKIYSNQQNLQRTTLRN